MSFLHKTLKVALKQAEERGVFMSMDELFKKVKDELEAKGFIELKPHCLRDLKEVPGVYVIYGQNLETLYVGQTNNLSRRMSQLLDFIYFSHVFTWGLFKNIVRIMKSEELREKDIEKIWYENKELREKAIKKLKELVNKLKLKYVELPNTSNEDLKKLESELENNLNPLKPHLKKNVKVLRRLMVKEA